MKTMYLHGMGGRRSRARIELVKSFGLDVYAKHIPYTKVDDGYEQAKAFALHHEVEFLVGHSHGGFYAFWLAEDLGLPCLLSNPHLSLSARKKVTPDIAQLSCPLCFLGLGEDDRCVPSSGTVKFLNAHQQQRPSANIQYRMYEAVGHGLDADIWNELLQWTLEEIAVLKHNGSISSTF